MHTGGLRKSEKIVKMYTRTNKHPINCIYKEMQNPLFRITGQKRHAELNHEYEFVLISVFSLFALSL